ncbi:rab11 family-interacting protein 1 isoform X2 [Varanus komodoensis]|uniref:rab11 family-interacting protein 1 isoform X2 n=1 Tax=Varanus komodoensis TaxID=61221 RepID=UPI001CF7D72A|nr:rab11 family-interacting protein 1 isoform X2 [Varanus komodoensis]
MTFSFSLILVLSICCIQLHSRLSYSSCFGSYCACEEAKRWYKLHSKPGKKEKERGEIEVDIQFMRSNMTASMFDLSMKDKSRTPLGKLKDKLKGKRGNGLPDTASAIIPSISHSPADDSEEDEKEKKKSKFKTLFSKPGLQKSNISQSMSVLPTLQPVSERVRLKPSGFTSRWSDDDDDTLTPVSEKPSTNKDEDNVVNPHSDMSHKRMGSGDSKQLNQIITNNSKKDVHSLFGGLKSKNDTVPRSNVCINGSHVYMEECESKSDTIPRDSTPSSPQTSQQKHHFLSQENLCSESNKELEISGRLPPDKGPPVSSSLESFKAMTLPSYKLLNSGDFLESNTPVISDTPKEAKENKKQENKKSGLLSLVTGKKEAKGNEEAENSIDTSPKVKEVKRNEKELPRKEINPFEIPSSDKSSATGVPIAKASLNPFNEKSEEEEKPEKSAVSVKPPETKRIKPRPDVSSEDETKATFTVPVPPPTSPFYHFHNSNKENNPFTSKLDAEPKAQDSDKLVSSSLNISARRGNNPFTTKWGQESKEKASENLMVDSFRLSSSSSENNPFSPKWGQESQIEDSENSAEDPLYSLHPPPASALETFPSWPSNVDNPFASENFNRAPESLSSTSLADNCYDSKHLPVVHLGKPQAEGLNKHIDPVSSFTRSVSESPLAHFYDQAGTILKTQSDDRVHTVPPFKEKNGRTKKSVTFALEELKDSDDAVCSGDETSNEDKTEKWHDENEDVVNPNERKRLKLELEVESCSSSKPHDGTINSFPKNESSLEREAEDTPSINVKPPVPAPRILLPLHKEANIPSTELSNNSLSVPPKPAPRSALKQNQSIHLSLSDESEAEDMLSSSPVFKEFPLNSSINSEQLTSTYSLAGSEPAILTHGRNVGTTDPSQSINNHSSHAIGAHLGILASGQLHVKPVTLPVIPEVGSDDELLSNSHQDAEEMAACGDLSHSMDDFTEMPRTEKRELTSDEKATGERQTISLVNISDPDDAVKPHDLLVESSAVDLQNADHTLKQKNGESFKEDKRGGCPEFPDKPVPLSPLSSSFQSHSPNSLQSDALGCNRAETPKKATTEALDAKGEISGKKKLLQARVSPSETHSTQTLQSGGTYPAKLRLQPVKPMNATTSKPAKPLSITTKMLDNQNEINLKKYDPSDPAYAYAQLTHDELIQLVLKQKDEMAKRDLQVRELEDYIDNLLVRVMEETPNILRVQEHLNKKAGKM